DSEPVVTPEEEQPQLVAVLQPVIDPGLVIPVDGNDAGDALVGVVGDEERQEDVDVAPPRRHRELRTTPDGPFEEGHPLDQVERSLSVEAGRVAFAGADVDRAGEVPSVHGSVTARIEVDPVEELLVDHRGSAEEM